MKKIYQASLTILILATLLSCSDEKESKVSQEHEKGPFYVEFVSCTKGNEYSKSSLSKMIESWRMLPISSELRGSYLYDPIKEENAFGPSMWWELEWESKDAADSAWSAWTENEAVMAWSNEYQNVMKPFYRIDKSRGQNKSGVGLGLSIATDIVHSHGGNISLEKSPLSGLRVKISLPL